MSKPATLIYTHGGGRLGNQIIRLIHWVAWSRAHLGAVNVIDLGFWRYAKYFSHWCNQPGCAFPQPSTAANFGSNLLGLLPEWLLARTEPRFQRVVQAVGGRWPRGGSIALNDGRDDSIDLDDLAFLQDIARRRVTTCSGWKIASWRLVSEQQTELRTLFRPMPPWAKVAADFIGELRQRNDLVIGVQIRQSDYRTWNQGHFYFSTTQYVGWIRQLLELHGGRRVAVVVASEEWQDPALFAGLPVYLATGNPRAGGHWLEDWIELSLCDLVLTAPSTFSATAAWLRAVPLWPVTAPNQRLAFDQLLRDPLVDAARHPVFRSA